MSIDIFCYRVDHNVGTVIQRILNIGTQEGIIHDHCDPMAMRHGCDIFDIDQPQRWIRRGLDPDQLSLIRTNQFLHVHFNGRREGDINTMGGSNLGEVPVGSAIDIRYGNDMRSDGQGLKNRSCGGRARGKGEGVFRMLEGRDSVLEVISKHEISNRSPKRIRASN